MTTAREGLRTFVALTRDPRRIRHPVAMLPVLTAVASGLLSGESTPSARICALRAYHRRQILGAAMATVGAAPAGAWCGGVFPGKNPGEPLELTVPFSKDGYRTDVFVRRLLPSRAVKSQRDFIEGLPAILLVVRS